MVFYRLMQCLLIYAFLTRVQSQGSMKESTIRNLRRQLLTRYDANSRPSLHDYNSTTVDVRIRITHLTEMNENTGILTLEGYASVFWEDLRLKWNPGNYSDLQVIQFSESEIWKPDLTLYNGLGGHTNPFYPAKLMVYSTGSVSWYPPAHMTLICEAMDYKKFPNDLQLCNIILGSWTQDSSMINLTTEETYGESQEPGELRGSNTLGNYLSSANPYWKIVKVEKRKEIKARPYFEADFVTIEYQLTMQRRDTLLRILCSTPVTTSKILMLCMFWVTKSKSKLLLVCTSLLALTMLAIFMTLNLPSPHVVKPALKQIALALAICLTSVICETVLMAIEGCKTSFDTLISIMRFEIQHAGMTQEEIITEIELREMSNEAKEEPPVPSSFPFVVVMFDVTLFFCFVPVLFLL